MKEVTLHDLLGWYSYFYLTPWDSCLLEALSHCKSSPNVLRPPCCRKPRLDMWKDHMEKPQKSKKDKCLAGPQLFQPNTGLQVWERPQAITAQLEL